MEFDYIFVCVCVGHMCMNYVVTCRVVSVMKQRVLVRMIGFISTLGRGARAD
jgi:hypothetical protein